VFFFFFFFLVIMHKENRIFPIQRKFDNLSTTNQNNHTTISCVNPNDG